MKLTYLGHSTFLIRTGSHRLLFDPFITSNPLAAEVKKANIEADFILLSHGHFDHVEDAVEIAKNTGATCIANYEIYEWLTRQGVSKAHPMNIGGGFDFPFGRVKMVPALHSSTLPDGSNGGSPAGFVIKTPEKAFYYSGDTALTAEMEWIGRSAKLDFAVLCIGDNFTMGVEDAILAAEILGVKTVLGVHYDTFPPIRIDHDSAKEAFAARNLTLLLPKIGETVDF